VGINIEDGTGKGFAVEVSSDNHLQVTARSVGMLQHSAILGESYNLSTPVINLTSANESGIFYVKNNDQTKSLILGRAIITLGVSTGGGTGDAILRVYQNPTAGTLVTAGAVITARNRNFGSIVPLSAAATSGVEGSTVTGGTLLSTLIVRASALLSFDLELTFPVGTAFAATFQPAAGNTSMNVAFVNVMALVDVATL
jgi:hypothetical protein